jgi:hypothetical protein
MMNPLKILRIQHWINDVTRKRNLKEKATGREQLPIGF